MAVVFFRLKKLVSMGVAAADPLETGKSAVEYSWPLHRLSNDKLVSNIGSFRA